MPQRSTKKLEFRRERFCQAILGVLLARLRLAICIWYRDTPQVCRPFLLHTVREHLNKCAVGAEGSGIDEKR